MTELGPGTRVWVGFTDNCEKGMEIYRCKTGTVYGEPYFNTSNKICWLVELDIGVNVGAAEHILFPIDGDEGLEDRKESQPEIEKEI